MPEGQQKSPLWLSSGGGFMGAEHLTLRRSWRDTLQLSCRIPLWAGFTAEQGPDNIWHLTALSGQNHQWCTGTQPYPLLSMRCSCISSVLETHSLIFWHRNRSWTESCNAERRSHSVPVCQTAAYYPSFSPRRVISLHLSKYPLNGF